MTITSTAITPATTGAVTGTYTLDPAHSRIGFVARHAMVTKVRGAFNEYEGGFTFDAQNPAASAANVTIEVASVDTRNGQRDAHLRANDFFDAPTFPQITFVSTGVEQRDDATYLVTGDLTIKGVTKPVTVEFEYTGSATDPFGHQRVGFEGKAVINRRDFGVNFNAALETGGALVSDKITLEFDISAVKVSADA